MESLIVTIDCEYNKSILIEPTVEISEETKGKLLSFAQEEAR